MNHRMSPLRGVLCLVVAVAVGWGGVALSGQSPSRMLLDGLAGDGELFGGGAWGSSEVVSRGVVTQRWTLQASSRDGVLAGPVTIAGSPLLTQGTVAGRIEGSGVWGTLRDDRGRQVATFTGSVAEDGRVQGRYQDRTGEVGTWEWERPRE